MDDGPFLIPRHKYIPPQNITRETKRAGNEACVFSLCALSILFPTLYVSTPCLRRLGLGDLFDSSMGPDGVGVVVLVFYCFFNKVFVMIRELA